MNTDMSTLTGAYAVNALTDPEREQFERHLAGCQDCAQEVDELRETAARLGADAAMQPPEALKTRVLDEIARTRQQSPRTRRARNARPIVPRPWTTRLAVAAAVLGVALASAFGGIAWQSQSRLADLNEQMQQSSSRHAEMATMLQAPDARIVQASAGGAQATTVISRDHGEAVFMASNMPAPPPDHAYQLWFIGDDGPNSAGMLQAESGDRMASDVARMPAHAAQMAVTIEPAGGSPQPTTDPVMAIDMPT